MKLPTAWPRNLPFRVQTPMSEASNRWPKPHHSQPVVVCRVQGEVGGDGHAHADFHVALDGLGVVHGQNDVEVDAAAP